MPSKTINIRSVCVYCASSPKTGKCYEEAAAQLGERLANEGIQIINGAGKTGLMRTLSDAALAKGGTVTGIIPQFMVEQGWHNENLTKLIVTGTIHERKQLMASMSDAAIALPGGCGTMEELLEIITWKQLGLYTKPVIMLNIDSFYDPLIEMLERAIQQQFMREQHRALWAVAANPAQALDILRQAQPWNPETRKFDET